MASRRIKIWGALALLALAGAGGWVLAGAHKSALPDELRDVVIGSPVALAPVTLNDQRGRPVTEAVFAGHWTFLSFGFTHCHDVCPANLAQLGTIKQALTQQFPTLAPPRFVFVSVDPVRDTPAQLAKYLSAFDSSFIGLTGSAEQISALEQPFAAFHRQEKASASGDYRVSHSGEIFLLDPAGRVYARFVPPLDPALVARQLNSIMTLYVHEAGQKPAPRT
jgi:protein SCO1